MTDQTLADFAKTLVPAPLDKSTVKARREDIEEAVKSKTAAVSLFESGSWSHGTSVAGLSDVDYMAFIPDSARPVKPSTALTNLKAALSGAHWAIIGRRISSPTVKVEFYTPPQFEVVPAYYEGETDGTPVFKIPGPGDEWVKSVPVGHNKYVSGVNDRHGKKVKALVRLVKAWKNHTGAPVSSFYLEIRTAHYASGQSAIIYDIDLRAVFRRLVDGEMRPMNDPLGIVPRIHATSSETNRLTALRLAKDALSNLEDADSARSRGDSSEYWSSMFRVFGYDYPYPYPIR